MKSVSLCSTIHERCTFSLFLVSLSYPPPLPCSFALYVAQEWQLQHCTRVGSFSTMTACSTSIHSTVQDRIQSSVHCDPGTIFLGHPFSLSPFNSPTFCCCVDVGTSATTAAAAQTMLLKSVRQTDRIVQCSAGGEGHATKGGEGHEFW